MPLTAKQISDINRSNRAMQNASLGTLVGDIGVHVVTAGEVAASAVVLDANHDSISGWLVQINRSGSTVTSDAKITGLSGSQLTIVDGGSTYTLTADDVISYFIF